VIKVECSGSVTFFVEEPKSVTLSGQTDVTGGISVEVEDTGQGILQMRMAFTPDPPDCRLNIPEITVWIDDFDEFVRDVNSMIQLNKTREKLAHTKAEDDAD
jgi:hypothetical protein